MKVSDYGGTGFPDVRTRAKSAVKDSERAGMAVRGFRQKLAECCEQLPGRDGDR